MPSANRFAWLLGWAIPAEWFLGFARTAWPQATHRAVYPGPAALTELAREAPYDVLAAHSFGAQLLLAHREQVTELATRVALLAPIWSLAREDNRGGNVPRASMRLLAKRLAGAPSRDVQDAALQQFYREAGLELAPDDLAADGRVHLLWGLQQLVEGLPGSPRLPAGWIAAGGAQDPLLDARRLGELVPGLRVIPGATHHPAALLNVLA
jgi:hypothetical protein